MTNAKSQTAISQVLTLLHEWDRGSKTVRNKILNDFINTSRGKTGPELEMDFAQAASLFLTRLTSWLRLTYMIGTCLNQQLQALSIFLTAPSGHKYMAEFIEVGGILTVLEIVGLKQANETDKCEALSLLMVVATAGRRYKELICESYGIRAVAECLARSQCEDTQDSARILLQELAQGNPRYEIQTYKGLIALLPSTSPKAQQMATQTLRIVQPIVRQAHPNIVEPLLGLLNTLHLEVQFEAIELIKDLMRYDEVQLIILKGLVGLLIPMKEDTILRPDILCDTSVKPINGPLPVYIQQAAAAKAIGILSQGTLEISEKLIQLRVVHNLMIAMGNSLHADSQRQAAITLEYLSRTFPVVNDSVQDAMGDELYHLFMSDPETMYLCVDAVQTDVLMSNKVNIPRAAPQIEQ